MRKRSRGGKKVILRTQTWISILKSTMLIGWQPAKKERPGKGWDFVPEQPNGPSKDAISVVYSPENLTRSAWMLAKQAISMSCIRSFSVSLLCQCFQFSLGWVCTMSLFELLTDHQKG